MNHWTRRTESTIIRSSNQTKVDTSWAEKTQYLVLNQQIQKSTGAISRLIPKISGNESVSDGGIEMKGWNCRLLQIAFRCSLHDLSARNCRSCKRHFVYINMGCQCSPSDGTVGRNSVNNAGWKSGKIVNQQMRSLYLRTLLLWWVQTISGDTVKYNTSERWSEGHTSAVNGVNSDGFITIVHPTARAGATFHALSKIRFRKITQLDGGTNHMLIG